VPTAQTPAVVLQRLDVVFVAQQDALSSVLADLARTLPANLPLQRIIDRLVERIIEVLPVTAVGISLISPASPPRYLAGSDASVERFEALQCELGEGPGVAAVESDQVISVCDLSTDERFPLFAAAATAAGYAAVFSFPLRHGDTRFGALDLYRSVPGDLEPDDACIARTLADVTAAYLLNAQTRDEARATADYFRHTALHDMLTGLPNRLLLTQRVEHAAQRARRSRTNAAVLFVDLDRFKTINDTYGHQIGDDLLRAVAERLGALVRPGDTLARFAGDEFVFLCEDLYDAADAESLAARIGDSFAQPFLLEGLEILVSASVGMAFAGPGQDVSEQLLGDADIAMYQAKRRGGGGHHVFDLRRALRTSDRIRLARDLRVAFDSNALEVAYQPIVRSADGRAIGVEALLRWNDPGHGRVAPLSVIAIAEQSGLIAEIGAWVLEQSCRDRARWLQAHPSAAIDLSVNVSARQLMNPDFGATVADVLSETGTAPDALIIEMTETIFIEDGHHAVGALRGLKERGIRVALDDFGTGYSSLSSLMRLPIDMVKIDNEFVSGIGHAPAGAEIVAAITSLAHGLGLAVTAEGVETKTQRDAVVAMECESSQGYYYARPMSAGAMSLYLNDHGIDLTGRPASVASAFS
jgi:diguanylate cyclase (GGDEF)-like protein